MSNPVLTTKLYPPPPRSNSVDRPRLIERLNTGFQPGKQLILVAASSGFGKTTLVSKWVAGLKTGHQVAWISIDESDNDPIRFMFYLIAALQRIDPEIGESILPVLQSSQTAPFLELIIHLINQIAAREKEILLVLDDYHLITSDAVHQVIQYLIGRQPGQMRTVILTREDPPFPLPRMRARGQVTEVRERDLRFTPTEAQAFLAETMGLKLSPENVAKLETRTEGWITGMQLAAIALEDYPDDEGRGAFINGFTGSDRFIVDYLASEVLQRQSESVQQFLLATSKLERFCAPLCDYILNDGDDLGQSQSILENLERGNMFLVPLDDRREWYRFHHLFAETLAHFARKLTPEIVQKLHRRASEWFESRGFVPEAVQHALASQDLDFITTVIDRHAMRLLIQGQGNLVISWCLALPEQFLRRMPVLCVYFAWSLVLTFRNDYLDAVEEKLRLAELAIQAPGLPTHVKLGHQEALVPLKDWVTGQVCVVRSQVLLARFGTFVDPQELISLSWRGLELLPEAEKPIRSTCRINLAIAYLIQNQPDEAEKAFDEALPFMLEAKNYLGAVTAIIYQARLAYYLGQLGRAEALCRQWKAKFAGVSDHAERDIPALRGLDIILAILLLERNQFDEAEQLIVQALELLGWASWEEFLGFLALARLRYLRKDSLGVEETLNRMAKMGPQHASCAEALQVLFEVKTSAEDPRVRDRAEAWTKAHAPDLDVPILPLGIGPYPSDVEYTCSLAWAQVQVALGHPQAALTYLEPALESAVQHRLTYRIVELMVASTLASEALGDHPSALAKLGKALGIAEPHGFVWVFAEGRVLEGLLAETAERKIHTEYVQRLFSSFRQISGGELSAGITVSPVPLRLEKAGHPALAEPVSEREYEVLNLIAAGYSNQQIGERLYIAEGTVKRHITNLYGKLGVLTRTQAIAKAREIGLIA